MRTHLLTLLTSMVFACGQSLAFGAQLADGLDPTRPTVPVVQTVGCVAMEGGSWFLTRATDPEQTEAPFASDAELEGARGASLGSHRFHLIGVADFLDTEGLLALHQRAEFTAEESVNATGQLVEGHKVVVKGLHITSVDPPRLNLTSVIGLADTCSGADAEDVAITAQAEDVTITDWRGVSVAVTEGSVDSNGVKIVYHTVGEGPLVIFVHSITGPWFQFANQIVMLSENYRVVAMSTRGTNKSDKPVGVEHYLSARISDDINAIIDHFDEDKTILIGQDSGGLHIWHFAYTHPERTDGLISLGSVHPDGLMRELMNNPDQQQANGFQRGMMENPEAGTSFGERLRGRPADPNDPLGQLRHEANQRTDPESIVGFYKANWPATPVTMETVGFGHKIGEFPPVTAPTLFLYGKDSGAFLNPTLNNMWELVDGPLAIQVLPGVGHNPHTEAPEIVTRRIVQWLETGQ